MKFGSLFSGIGGFDLAFERAGFTPAWQVEIDRDCNHVLRRHWPDVSRYADVREVNARNLEPVDAIVFGSPCQDLSVAGQRRGFNGERSSLFFEAARIIRELRPVWALWENVPGALTSNAGRDFGAILDALANAGAVDLAWRVLDAQWFGVAQRRRRVFVVADFRSERAGQILFEPKSLRGDSSQSRTAGQDVATTVSASAGHHGRSSPRGDGRDNLVTATLRASAGSGRLKDIGHENVVLVPAKRLGGHHHRQDLDNETYVAAPLTASYAHAAQTAGDNPGVSNVVIEPSARAHALTAHTAKGGDPTTDEYVIAWDKTNITSKANRSNPQPGDSCHTLHQQAPSDAGSLGVRRLTPIECSRLQGFPDNWNAWGINERGELVQLSDSVRYRQLGNAVCVNVAEWIARRLMEASQ